MNKPNQSASKVIRGGEVNVSTDNRTDPQISTWIVAPHLLPQLERLAALAKIPARIYKMTRFKLSDIVALEEAAKV
jgi:hypothetical protein